MPEDRTTSQKAQMPTNLRLLRLVEEVAMAGVPVTPPQIADALDLPRPTVHRLLATAEQEGFIQRDVDGRSYGPGKRMRRMAGNTLSSQRIRTERLIIMRALAEKVGETCNLAAPDRDAMTYLDRVETHWPLRIQLPVGTRVPLHCTASGKMYLSSLRTDKLDRLLGSLLLEKFTANTLTNPEQLRQELSEVRSRGYATDEQEFMDGMTAIAVPICDTEGRLLTTLSIHYPIVRHKPEGLLQHLGALRKTALAMEELCNN